MKRAALALALIMVIAGCGAGNLTIAGTRLTINALNPWVGMATFHLSCSPVSGDVTDPAAACRALANDPGLITTPKPFVCIGSLTSWFDVTISGRLHGKPLHRKFSTCWTPQSATLGKLGVGRSLTGHIRARRAKVIARGSSRTFPAGALRPGDLLICRFRGHQVRLGVNDRIGSMGSVGGSEVSIAASRHADGSITAHCRG